MRKSLIIIGVAVLIVAGVVAFVTVRRNNSANTVATTSTTTTTVPIPIAPLTGLPDPTGAGLKRSALTVKIENTPEALPQWGVEDADVVYEEIVNGGITRLAAIFNSQAPIKVGPVRSVRPTDTQVVSPIGGIFAYSGGAPYAVTSIESVHGLKLVDESSAGTAMFRDLNLEAPHNLFGVAPALFAFGGTPTPPKPLFAYRPVTRKVTGRKINTFIVHFPSIYSVTWTWDSTTTSWDRTLFGKSDVTGAGAVESPKNVIVMYVDYVNGVGAFTSYANLQGTGPADIFTDGREIIGTWSRGSSMTDPLTYQTASGQVITMTPGQTWVELLNSAGVVTLNPPA
jgi:hypothetical protein